MKSIITNETSHIIVDFQNDFVESKGALSVNAQALWWTISELITLFASKGMKNIATKDWHPKGHSSFASSKWEEATYTDWSWPDHCVAWTWGAELHWTIAHKPDWIVHKWKEIDKEAYSWFQWTPLWLELKNEKIKTVIITWVATDYCVDATARDAIQAWLRTVIVSNAIKAVNKEKGEEKINEMKSLWIEFYTSDELIELLQ